MSAARRAVLLLAAAMAAAAAPAVAQGPAPVIAVGSGSTFAAALADAVRMAVESRAGLTLTSAVAARDGQVVSDSIHSVSRGVVTRYTLLDSTSDATGARVRILAMVARVSERPALPAAGASVSVPGALWAASAEVEATRAREEGSIVAQLFGETQNAPSLYDYRVLAGAPVATGRWLTMRLHVVRVPNRNYGAAVDRVAAVLGALAGEAGDRTIHFPVRERDLPVMRQCVSVCGDGERRLLDAWAVLAPTDSFAGFDPPVVTAPGAGRVAAIFPDLPTAGGFGVAFPAAAAGRVRFVRVRSTRAFFTIADYLRTLVDEARFELRAGTAAVALRQTARRAWTGESDVRLLTRDADPAITVTLVRGFRDHVTGGAGSPRRVGSWDATLWVPDSASVRPDTAVLDLALDPARLGRLDLIAVRPLGVTRRFVDAECSDRRTRWPDGSVRSARACTWPEPVDDGWRPLPTVQGVVER